MSKKNQPSKQIVPGKKDQSHPFALLRQEMNTLFDNFFHGFDIAPSWGRIDTFNPKVDVKETDKNITVSAEMPGMDDKDIDVSLSRDALTIKGEKKEEKEEKGKDFVRMERSFGSFSRTIPLPVEIDTDKAKAEFKKGVLTVTLPKTAKAIEKTKKISVKAE